MSIAVALSTMWAQQPRFESDMTSFAAIARAAGYSHIEVSHSTGEPGLQALMQQTELPISSLHAPTPLVRTPNGRWNTDLNLAAEDEAERAAAVTATVRTLELAAEAGAGSVVVHLGGVGSRGVAGDGALRRLYQAGTRDGAEVERQRASAAAERARGRERALGTARRSLAELTARARTLGVRLGLENRMWYHEIPLPDEVAGLLAEHEPAVAGYWHDVGHAEILDRIGLVPLGSWFELAGPRLIGCHLHDMQGIVDHRAPGTGDVDWPALATALGASTVRTFEINQLQPQETLAEGLALLQRLGVVPPTAGQS